MKRILTIIAVALMCVAVARAEDEFVPQMECIDGIWYETFMPSKETVPSNDYGLKRNCAEVLGVGTNEVFARVCCNESEEILPITADITIPSHVTIGGKEYEVIATGKNSLGKITNGATVTLPSTIKLIGTGSVWAKWEEKYTGDFYPTIVFDEAYIEVPESIVAIEESSFFGLKSKQEVYLPEISILDYYSLNGFAAPKLILGSRLTAIRNNSIATVDELVFEDGDDKAMKWDGLGVPSNHTYFGSESIYLNKIRELKLPKWEKLTLFDGFISHSNNLERVVFPDLNVIKYETHINFSGSMGLGYRGVLIQYCPNLKEVVCLGTTPPYIKYDPEIFDEGSHYWGDTGEFEIMDNIDDCVLKVPAGSEELYRADPVWGKFKTIYGFENGDYTSIVMPEVAASEAEAAPVYHNLQGMKVERPEHGQLYIRTIGSRTDKVVF